MKYKDIDYGIKQEDRPGKSSPHFRWIIYQKLMDGPKVVGQELYSTSEEAETACKAEIEAGLRGLNA